MSLSLRTLHSTVFQLPIDRFGNEWGTLGDYGLVLHSWLRRNQMNKELLDIVNGQLRVFKSILMRTGRNALLW